MVTLSKEGKTARKKARVGDASLAGGVMLLSDQVSRARAIVGTSATTNRDQRQQG
jgi:hypothetical protein